MSVRLLLLVVLFLLLSCPARARGPGRSRARSCRRSRFDQAHPYAGGQHRGIDIGAGSGRARCSRPPSGVVSFAGSVPANGQSLTILTPAGLVREPHASRLDRRRARRERSTRARSSARSGRAARPSSTCRTSTSASATTSNEQGYLDPLGFLPVLAPPPPAAPPAAGSGACARARTACGCTRARAGAGRRAGASRRRPRRRRSLRRSPPRRSRSTRRRAPSAGGAPCRRRPPPSCPLRRPCRRLPPSSRHRLRARRSRRPPPVRPFSRRRASGRCRPLRARCIPVTPQHARQPAVCSSSGGRLRRSSGGDAASVWHPMLWPPSRARCRCRARAARPAVGSSAHAATATRAASRGYRPTRSRSSRLAQPWSRARRRSYDLGPSAANEGARPAHAEDPRRAGVAVREWAAPYRPRGRASPCRRTSSPAITG